MAVCKASQYRSETQLVMTTVKFSSSHFFFDIIIYHLWIIKKNHLSFYNDGEYDIL